MSVPDWLTPLPDAEASRAIDAWAIEDCGIRSLDLMERAATGLAELVQEVAPAGLVVICCGPGNNGGDGYAAARLLREAWREVRVVAVADPAVLKGDARRQLERLPGEPPRPFREQELHGAAVIVDALLGTGFSGVPRGTVAAAIAAIGAQQAPVVAADVPSGVDGSTGAVAGDAIMAVATAAFHAAKPGLWVAPGKRHAGVVRTVDIGIPPQGSLVDIDTGLIADGPLLAALPGRAAHDTKFSSGTVLVAGGSRGLLGAVTLCCEAAMRSGAGYVLAAVPPAEQRTLAAHLVEVMQIVLAGAGCEHDVANAAALLAQAEERGAVLVVGPGLGRAAPAAAFARALVAAARQPVVLDADGLNAFAGEIVALRARAAPTILTPHAGELARLLGSSSGDVDDGRLAAVRRAARESGAIVVLKGDDTLVADPQGLVAVSPGATPALATAGTGDVLSGVVAALLARGVEPFAAACAAVRVHARAGLRAAERVGAEGVIASDVVAELAAARSGA